MQQEKTERVFRLFPKWIPKIEKDEEWNEIIASLIDRFFSNSGSRVLLDAGGVCISN